MDSQDQQAAPPWAQAMMQQIEESQLVQQQRATAQDERIRRLEDMLARQIASSPTEGNGTETTTEPTPILVETISTTAVRRPRPRLPDPPLYAGSVNDWSTWRITMENKLVVDGEAIGSRQDQFMYVFSRLEKLAWKNTATYVKHCRNEDGPEDLLNYLEKIYGDANAQARAARKLH
jgi:hypothetical protein